MKGRIFGAPLGAAFLMATSAIGPGFLTQTTVFTEKLLASFGFVILVSILFDLGAQLNVWRIIAATGRRGNDIANATLPGLGHALSVLIIVGALAFNVGNVAGAGLGLNVLFDLDVRLGASLSAAIAVAIFMSRSAGKAIDRFAQVMGGVMIAITLYVAIASSPPVGTALLRTIAPETVEFLPIVTIVGGTVGGYIMFAGGHRLLDAGVTSVQEATRSAALGIGVASLMRVLLFLAALGVFAHGFVADPANPPASVFRAATGELGYKLFGVVLWAAAVSSVVGASYTAVSFLFPATRPRRRRAAAVAFVAFSALVFVVFGRPVKVLILAGALNGLILPAILGSMLWAANSKRVVGDYRHPVALSLAGGVVAVAMACLGVYTLVDELQKLFD